MVWVMAWYQLTIDWTNVNFSSVASRVPWHSSVGNFTGIVQVWPLSCMCLWTLLYVMANVRRCHMASAIIVNIVSGNGLVPSVDFKSTGSCGIHLTPSISAWPLPCLFKHYPTMCPLAPNGPCKAMCWTDVLMVLHQSGRLYASSREVVNVNCHCSHHKQYMSKRRVDYSRHEQGNITDHYLVEWRKRETPGGLWICGAVMPYIDGLM